MLRWEKVMAASGIDPAPARDTLQIEFASAVAKPSMQLTDFFGGCPGLRSPFLIAGEPPREGAYCPGFDDTPLNAGRLRITGPGFAIPVVAPRLDNGRPLYRVDLPRNNPGRGGGEW